MTDPIDKRLTNEQRATLNDPKDGYYISFDPTGVPEVDRILSAIGWAGKAYHHTESWNDASDYNYGPIAATSTPCELIQAAANDAAATIAERQERVREFAEKLDADADANADTHPKESRALLSVARDLLAILDAKDTTAS